LREFDNLRSDPRYKGDPDQDGAPAVVRGLAKILSGFAEEPTRVLHQISLGQRD
jgi:hypothetical protein